jgi:hypothetical protein
VVVLTRKKKEPRVVGKPLTWTFIASQDGPLLGVRNVLDDKRGKRVRVTLEELAE